MSDPDLLAPGLIAMVFYFVDAIQVWAVCKLTASSSDQQKHVRKSVCETCKPLFSLRSHNSFNQCVTVTQGKRKYGWRQNGQTIWLCAVVAEGGSVLEVRNRAIAEDMCWRKQPVFRMPAVNVHQGPIAHI